MFKVIKQGFTIYIAIHKPFRETLYTKVVNGFKTLQKLGSTELPIRMEFLNKFNMQES